MTKTSILLFPKWAAIIPLLTLACTGQVTTQEVDTDGDGMAEIVLANKHVRIVIDKGLAPHLADETVYDERFVRGGWVRSIRPLPDGGEFLLQPHERRGSERAFTGIREEFETAIQLFEGNPDGGTEVRFVKIGVGVFAATADGRGGWQVPQLVAAPPWETRMEKRDDGGIVIAMTQALDMTAATAYVYQKRFTLGPDSRRLTEARVLTNTGVNPISSLWYLHPFFAPESGLGYGESSRLIVPIRNAANTVDMTPVKPLKPDPLPIRGALAGSRVALPWMAAGTARRGPWLRVSWGSPCEWLQVGTSTNYFSAEPCIEVDLATNESWAQPVQYEWTQTTPAFPETPGNGQPHKSEAIILTNKQNNTEGSHDDLALLLPILRDANIRPTVVNVATTSPTEQQWNSADSAIVVGDVPLQDRFVKRLRKFVSDGGGLVTNSRELMTVADWLPAVPTGKSFKSPLKLRDDPRNRGRVPAFTLHMQAAADVSSQPIPEGLVLHPETDQCIARAIELVPVKTAETVLELHRGNELPEAAPWPAVIVGECGRGRVLCVAFPVAWGISPTWVNWARLGEYHRRFWTQCVRYTTQADKAENN